MEEIKSFTENNNERDKTPLKSIGNFIKEARLSRDQSVEELASDLKIGAHQLKAIEDGKEDELPEKVFVKAMIRRISQKLKLDTELIMSELKAISGEAEIEEIVEEASSKTDKKSKPKKLNLIGFGIFILISGFLGLMASSLIFNFLSDSFQNQTPKQDLIKQN